MNKKILLCITSLLILSISQAQTIQALNVPKTQALIGQAQLRVTAYFPYLINYHIAQSLKDAVNQNVEVTILAPRNAHMIGNSYLPSLALSSAQKPPRPLEYHFVTLNSPAFIVIDNKTVLYGNGLTNGVDSITLGNAAFLNYALSVSERTLKKSPAVPASLIIKERLGLPR